MRSDVLLIVIVALCGAIILRSTDASSGIDRAGERSSFGFPEAFVPDEQQWTAWQAALADVFRAADRAQVAKGKELRARESSGHLD
jgi:hypothetical protein